MTNKKTATGETKLGTIRNGRYTVTILDELAADGLPTYLIHGARGACYGLLRNKNPRLLFATNANRPSGPAGPFEGVWFEETEKGLWSTAGDIINFQERA